MIEPVQLICVASYHDNTVYNWEIVGKKQNLMFPSSPVVYVSRPGIFQCKVVNFVKGQAMSQMMEVQLEPGLFVFSIVANGSILLIFGYFMQVQILVVRSLKHKDAKNQSLNRE